MTMNHISTPLEKILDEQTKEFLFPEKYKHLYIGITFSTIGAMKKNENATLLSPKKRELANNYTDKNTCIVIKLAYQPSKELIRELETRQIQLPAFYLVND